MEGLTNESIVVRGRGHFQLSTSGIQWPGLCAIQVSEDRHVSLNGFHFSLLSSPPAFGVFEGIDGYEIIGSNITAFLDSVASKSITMVDRMALTVTTSDLLEYLNNILQVRKTAPLLWSIGFIDSY